MREGGAGEIEGGQNHRLLDHRIIFAMSVLQNENLSLDEGEKVRGRIIFAKADI
jgi:hypothetical protein